MCSVTGVGFLINLGLCRAPKHTLPSVPRPIFHPLAFVVGPAPRARCSDQDGTTGIPALIIPSPAASDSWSPSGSASGKILRGPWDHSGSIPVPFDVEKMLAPLKAAVVSAR